MEAKKKTVSTSYNLNTNTNSWIISGWKRQGQMKQEVRNVGKFSASLSLPTGYYPTISISIMRL